MKSIEKRDEEMSESNTATPEGLRIHELDNDKHSVTTDDGGQNDLRTEADINESADKNDRHQDVSSIDNKDIHKDKQNKIYELKLESTCNDNLKLDPNNGDKNFAEEIVNVEDKHKVAKNDPKDEQNKELKTKLNQPTDHESNLKLDSKTDSDLLSSKEIEKECSKKDKETSENQKTDETKADLYTKPTEGNKERKVKKIKKKKKKSPIAEESSEIQFDELDEQDVSSIDNKDIHKDKQNQIYELKLESTCNDNLKLEPNNGEKNSAEENVNVEDKHKVDNNDPKDEQNKELKTKLNQPTDHESNLKLDSKTDSDLLSSKEIEKECSKKDKETSENQKTDETKADLNTKPTEENKKTKEEPEMYCKKNMKNLKENSSQERKVKVIKNKKKKSPIAEESSEIQFDELLLPKEIENKCPEKTENSYIEVNPVKDGNIHIKDNFDDSCVAIEDSNLKSSEKLEFERNFSKDSPEWYLAETKKAANIIEATVKYTPPNRIETDNEIFYNEEIQDKLVQAGLVEVSSSFFPLAVLHEIVPESLTSLPAFEKICGTYLVKKILRTTALTVQDIMKYVDIGKFESERIHKTADYIRSLHSNSLCSTIPIEIAQSEFHDPYQKGIKIAKNIIAQETKEVALKEIFSYVERANFKNFSSPMVQTAYLRLAQRISSPTHVNDILSEEFAEDKRQEDLLGFKVLAKVSSMNPYMVSNIESFVTAEDLADSKKSDDLALSGIVSEIKNCALMSEEFVANICSSSPSKMELSIQNCIAEIHEHMNENSEASYNLLKMYPILDNIPVQAALVSSAMKISSPSLVHNTVAAELIKKRNILPYMGLVAVKSLYQHEALNTTNMDTCIKECILEDKREKMHLAQWENIASFLQSGNVPKEYIEIDDTDRKPKHLFALEKIVESLKETSFVDLTEIYESVETNPSTSILNNLGAQIVMANLSEKLVSAPITESILSFELTSSSSVNNIPFFGFRALKTAIENLPITITFDDISSFISTQDFDDEAIGNKVALMLNTAYSIRKLVSVKNLAFFCLFFHYVFV